jgi:hypothetical protein
LKASDSACPSDSRRHQLPAIAPSATTLGATARPSTTVMT